MSASQPLVVFSHGKETGPNGRKINTLREVAHSVGAQTLSVDYSSTLDPALRVQLLLDTVLPEHNGLILVGSSMGGYVSTVASRTLKPDALLLMAPAFGLEDYPEPYPAPSANSIAAVHGWQDEVVPVENTIRWANHYKAKLVLVNDDHSLHKEVDTVGELLVKMTQLIKTRK